MGVVRRREVGEVARACGLLLFVSAIGASAPLEAQSLNPPTRADYDRWESLGAMALSPSGSWAMTSIRRQDGTVAVQWASTTGAGEPAVIEQAAAPAFSGDSRWLAYRKAATPDEVEDGEPDDPALRDRLGLLDLERGVDSVLHAAQEFRLRDDGEWIATHGYASSDTVGADLTVMNLDTGARTTLGNVDQFAWQDDGPLLAVTVRTAWGDGNGVLIFDPETSRVRTLDSRDARYRSLVWEEGSRRLAVLRSVSEEGRDQVAHDALVWGDAGAEDLEPAVLAAQGGAGVPDGWRIPESSPLRFETEADLLVLGVRPWEAAAEEETESADTNDEEPTDEPDAVDGEEDVEPSDVQVWHWDDDRILRAQEWSADQDERRTLAAVWHLNEDRMVMVGRDLTEPVRVLPKGTWGLVPDYDPYLFERRFGAGTADWYRVDLRTGERTLFVEGVESGVVAGPDGEHGLVFEDDTWSVLEFSSGDRRVLGEGVSTEFTRALEDFDYPGPRPSWGTGGWLAEGSGALLYDKYDVWRAEFSSLELTRLTRGREEGVQFRAIQPDAQLAGEAFDPNEPVWLSVRHLTTKTSGFAIVEPNRAVRTLLYEEASVGRLTKARDADRYQFSMERWDDSPDAFSAAQGLTQLRQVSSTNSFQSEFSWGRSELIPYTTDAGLDLQAVLIYPAEFEEGRTYPLILYQYERLSDQVHRYRAPSRTDYYNPQVWSQEGYFVLMPDIVYEPGRPGPSALDAVDHALDAAVATGHVDANALGLVGHSWGGYQAAYLPTRTDRFAASVAGAAITNFLSFMGAVHWNGGLPEVGHWETGQARMAVPYWDDFEGHLESSPVHKIQDLNTPVLLMHGDADGVVDFRQGLEFYNYARRAGKEVVLLVYPGSDHGLRREQHQVDYQQRIMEWFDHHLRGAEPASWITDGESWEERAKRIEGDKGGR